MPTNLTVDVACPNCTAMFKLPRRFVGRGTKCTKCGEAFTIEEFRGSTQGNEVNAASSKNVRSVSSMEWEESVVPNQSKNSRERSDPSSSRTPRPDDPEVLLTLCPDCKASVSKRALNCPQCGAPLISSIPMEELTVGELVSSGTDPFAVLTLIAGALSLLFLPIVFAPMALVSGAVSTNSLMRDPLLGGGGMRTGGMILAGISLLVMFVRISSIELPY